MVLQGMLRSAAVGQFYKDLTNPAYETAFAVYHRRYSTNTTPKWPLAQPMRFLGHNGECICLLGTFVWWVSEPLPCAPVSNGYHAQWNVLRLGLLLFTAV